VTFEEAVEKKNRATWIWLAVGAAIVAAATWCLMAFVVFVHLKLEYPDARLTITVVLTLVWGAYFFGWTVRGNLVESIDMQMRTAGPFEKDRVAARIDQEQPPAERERAPRAAARA